MTNYEKYKDLVISCIAKDSICDLAHVAYGDNSCYRRTCKECCNFTAEWVKRECVGIDWAKVAVDTQVVVTVDTQVVGTREDGVFNRHFARYHNGMVEVYAYGQTSWSNAGKTVPVAPERVKLRKPSDYLKYAK